MQRRLREKQRALPRRDRRDDRAREPQGTRLRDTRAGSRRARRLPVPAPRCRRSSCRPERTAPTKIWPRRNVSCVEERAAGSVRSSATKRPPGEVGRREPRRERAPRRRGRASAGARRPAAAGSAAPETRRPRAPRGRTRGRARSGSAAPDSSRGSAGRSGRGPARCSGSSRRGPAAPPAGSPTSCPPRSRRGTRAGPRASRRGSRRRRRCRERASAACPRTCSGDM